MEEDKEKRRRKNQNENHFPKFIRSLQKILYKTWASSWKRRLFPGANVIYLSFSMAELCCKTITKLLLWRLLLICIAWFHANVLEINTNKILQTFDYNRLKLNPVFFLSSPLFNNFITYVFSPIHKTLYVFNVF